MLICPGRAIIRASLLVSGRKGRAPRGARGLIRVHLRVIDFFQMKLLIAERLPFSLNGVESMTIIGRLLSLLMRVAGELLFLVLPAAAVLYLGEWIAADLPLRGILAALSVLLYLILRQMLSDLLFVLRLRFLDGAGFEAYCERRLRRHGYRSVERTQKSRDHGADILARRGIHRYVFQCKLYQSPVGNSAVQQAFTAMNYYDCDIAVVITNQRFTSQAIREAEKLGVELWDRQVLRNL